MGVAEASDVVRRRWVKETSKSPSPTRFDGEVSVKYATDDEPVPGGQPVPFGTVRMVAEAPGGVAGGASAGNGPNLDT